MNTFYFFIISLGLFIYLFKPRYFFLYWLSTPAFVVPLFFIFFHPSYSGGITFYSFYYGFIHPLCYLLIIITIIEFYKYKGLTIKYMVLPFIVLCLYFVIQNIGTGFSVKPLLMNIRDAVILMTPTLALSFSPRLRPSQKDLIQYIIVYFIIQFFFCFLNFNGVRLYSNYNDDVSFADAYLCGTFYRYNHLTNYLTSFFLVFSFAYFIFSSISKYIYIILSTVICIVILLSGARMSVILFFVTIGSFLLFYRKKNYIFLSVVALSFLYGASYLSSKYDIGIKNADKGSGLERNVTGLVDLLSSKNNKNNTLSISEILILTRFSDPLLGNGYAYRNTNKYNLSASTDEITIKSDACMAYMLVEYGFIGCICYGFFFYGIIKLNIVRSRKFSRKMWIIVLLYYILFTLTEAGMFDLMQLSIISIFCFSKRKDKYDYYNYRFSHFYNRKYQYGIPSINNFNKIRKI